MSSPSDSSMRFRRPGEEADSGAHSVTSVPVLIIGAGESGIAMGCRLKSVLKFDRFRIVDRQAGIGGVWWSNRYPGVACDVPSSLYSFSFSPFFQSSTLFPTGAEFLQYLNDVMAKFKITDNIQLNTDVSHLRYIEEMSEWEAVLISLAPGAGDLSERERQERVVSHGSESVYLRKEVIRVKVVISCVGQLVQPNAWPSSIPGRDSFTGAVFHSSRWNKDVDLNGKDVVVIGTGCSAAQLVPAILKEPYKVKSVTQLLRHAPWVMARLQEPFGKERYAKYAPTVMSYLPFLGWIIRFGFFSLVELVWYLLLRLNGTSKNIRMKMETATLDRTFQVIPKKYHQIMTPDYGYGCKRRVFDNDWLESMNRPNFHLTKRPLMVVENDQLVLGPDPTPSLSKEENQAQPTRIHADVIILANGFEGTRWIHPLTVHGKDNHSLHDVWHDRGSPQTYMGMAIDGFPNFFLIGGPNTGTAHSSMIVATEIQVNYIIKIIKPVLAGKAEFVEVKKNAVVQWDEEIQRDMKRTVFLGCRSFYQEKDGRNSMLYPRSQTEQIWRHMFPEWKHWNVAYTKK